jgi:integrase
MATDKLTASAVKAAAFEDKAYKLFDGRGLFLHVKSAGKYWRMKYRLNGREKLLAIGLYPDLSLREARDRRDEARKLLREGIDPSAHKQALKSAQNSPDTFEVIAREWWASVYQKKVVDHLATLSLRRLESHAFPVIGRLPVSELTAPEVLGMLRRIEEQGKGETARRVKILTSQVMRYAIITGRAERDPTADLRGALAPVKSTHHAAVTEPQQLGELLRAMDGYGGTPVVRYALCLAPIFFVRPGDLRHMKWADVDLDKGEWRFTPQKMRNSSIPEAAKELVVPLAKQAIGLLTELWSVTGRGVYAFPSARSPKGDRPMSENAVLAALRGLGIPREVATGHGFRATARTLIDEELGFPPHLIEHQLGHVVRDPLGRAYNRTTHLPQRREMMQAWADYLDRLKAITSDARQA